MGWACVRLVYKANSPIHVGYHKLGNIQRSRHYITGRAMWGAATASLSRSLIAETGSNQLETYRNVGMLMRKRLIFSYFFVVYAFKDEELDFDRPLLLNHRLDEPRYGFGKDTLAATEFERELVVSLPSTAIDPALLCAEDGSLHETEALSPITQVSAKQVYFVGHLFINSGEIGGYSVNTSEEELEVYLNSKPLLKTAFANLYVGGERRYGFGSLNLHEKGVKVIPSDRGLFETCPQEYIWSGKGENPVISVSPGYPFLAHLTPLEVKGHHIKGEVEPFLGREWEARPHQPHRPHHGPGQSLSGVMLSWIPGSVSEDSKMDVRVLDFGVWEVISKEFGS